MTIANGNLMAASTAAAQASATANAVLLEAVRSSATQPNFPSIVAHTGSPTRPAFSSIQRSASMPATQQQGQEFSGLSMSDANARRSSLMLSQLLASSASNNHFCAAPTPSATDVLALVVRRRQEDILQQAVQQQALQQQQQQQQRQQQVLQQLSDLLRQNTMDDAPTQEASPVTTASTLLPSPPPSSSPSSTYSVTPGQQIDVHRILHELGSTPKRSRMAANSQQTQYVDVTRLPGIAAHLETLQPERNNHGARFPYKLHQMLNEVPASLASFDQPHCRTFTIHDPPRFVSEAMPKYFKHSHWSSFCRQLNLWGFARVDQALHRPRRRHPNDPATFLHELFRPNLPRLCEYMRRVGVPPGKKPTATSSVPLY